VRIKKGAVRRAKVWEAIKAGPAPEQGTLRNPDHREAPKAANNSSLVVTYKNKTAHPYVPKRVSVMMRKISGRDHPPPIPSLASANPSSWKHPVNHNPDAVAIADATDNGNGNDVAAAS